MLLCCTLSFNSCSAGPDRGPQVNFSVKKYSFIHSERNEIIHAEVMDSFFEQLYTLREGAQRKVSVLQIGDSHIQCDLLSTAVRNDFQANFGNAGRGLVVPLRVAGTNESYTYKISSNVVCSSKRCVFVNDPMPIGIGGVTIKSYSENTALRIRTFNYPGLDYSFTRMRVFYEKNDSAYDFQVLDTAGNILANMHSIEADSFPNSSTVQLPNGSNDVTLRAHKMTDMQTHVTIFGMDLENDSSGVVYHSVGVNGAEAFQFYKAQYFAEQTKALAPSLIILSLGTNEAQRVPFDKVATEQRLDSLIQALRFYNPSAAILLTTPADSYLRKKYYNSGLATLHTMMVDYAREHHIAIWDLYSIAGGYKSCYQWKISGLMRADGVHFDKAGYEFQGNLMYEAIVQAYDKYVQKAHPQP